MPETVPAGYIEKIAPDGQRHWFKVGTPEEKIQAEMQPVSTGEDVAKSIPSGLARGVAALAGMPGDVKAGADWLFSKIAGPPPVPPPAEPGSLAAGLEKLPFVKNVPGTPEATGAIESVTGPLYEPQTSAGKLTGKIAEFAPNIAAGPGGLVRKAVTQVVAPAVGNEVAGQATEGTPYEKYARLLGTLFGGATPSAIERQVRPAPITADRQHLINSLDPDVQETLTAGQRTGNLRVQNFETELGGAAYRARKEQQADALTRAATRPIGGNERRMTTANTAAHVDRMGHEFDRLEAASTVPFDQGVQNNLLNAAVDYESVGGIARGVEGEMNHVAQLAGRNGGVLTGEALQTIRSRWGRLARQADPQTRMAFRNMQEALDDAIERNISPQLRQDWQTVRRQYRNYLVLEDALTKAGRPAIAEGQVPPDALWGPQVAQNQRAFATGRDDYSGLAHAGTGLLKEPPQSGTAGRLRASTIPAAVVASTIGAGHAASTGDLGTLVGSLLGSGAVLAAPAVAGRAVMTRPVQNWLAGAQPGDMTAATRRQLLLQALTAPRLFNPPGENR